MSIIGFDFMMGLTIGLLLLPVISFIESIWHVFVDRVIKFEKDNDCYDCEHECQQGRHCKHDQ